MRYLLIKKRKDEFEIRFKECQDLMIDLQHDILNIKHDDFPDDIKRLFITVCKNYRIEMRKMFSYNTINKNLPNYVF